MLTCIRYIHILFHLMRKLEADSKSLTAFFIDPVLLWECRCLLLYQSNVSSHSPVTNLLNLNILNKQ